LAAKLTVVLAEAHQLRADELSWGAFPMGYFIEPNTAVNTRYLGPLRLAGGQVVDGSLPRSSNSSTPAWPPDRHDTPAHGQCAGFWYGIGAEHVSMMVVDISLTRLSGCG
jgi:hypothetical protein